MKLKLTHFIAAGAAMLAMAGSAQARDVHWNVGIHAAPGITVGIGNSHPVYVAPAPVYYGPPPVYYAPPPVVYSAPRYYVQPAPVYYAPRGHYRHHRNKHRHGRHGHRH